MKLTYVRRPNSMSGVLVAELENETLYIRCNSGQPGFENTDFVRGKSPTPRGNHWLYTKQKNPKAALPSKANEIGPSFCIGGETDDTTILGANGQFRKNIELHFDQKNPSLRGSAGCPAISQDDKKDADKLYAALDEAHKKGIKKVPFIVVME
jgi:hypothetical protein